MEKDSGTFNEEEDEDTLGRKDLKLNDVEQDEDSRGGKTSRGTMFHRDTREIHQRNIRDKWFPREACFVLGVVKVGKDIVTFNDEKDEDALVEEGPQIERGLVFHRDACHREIYQRNIRDKRLLHEVYFDLGDVKVGETHCDLQSRGG